MARTWMALAMTLAGGAAYADGFAVSDLTTLDVDTSAFETGVFETLPKPERLMVACLECTRTVVVTLRLGTSTDPEVEQNLRDGTMDLGTLKAACAAAQGAVTCVDVEMVQVGNAIGWVTRTQSAEDRHLMTYELYLDGETLDVQAIAETRDEADVVGKTAYDTIVPSIVLGTGG